MPSRTSVALAREQDPSDVGRLFSAYAPRLRLILSGSVRASDDVIEDACQSAWARLVLHARTVDGGAAELWLARTASREAFKLDRRERRDVSLDQIAEDCGGKQNLPFPDPKLDPHAIAVSRERIDAVRVLPAREQRVIWLHAAGHTYREIEHGTGWTRRTVDRQLTRARRRARAVADG